MMPGPIVLLWPDDADPCEAYRATWTGEWRCDRGCRSGYSCLARKESFERLEALRKNATKLEIPNP